MQDSVIDRTIKKYQTQLEEACQTIWQNPEPGYQEYTACDSICNILADEDFEIQTGIAGLPTAIRASWGSRSPVIGFLAEYDALPGLSQGNVPYRDVLVPEGYGHGCGHNLIATACLGAVLGLKAVMETEGLAGTLVYLGCPAEESMGGKIFMARDGIFNELDCAISFHPMCVNKVTVGSGLAVNNAKIHFHGIPAHASADPYNGRSALDAVELTNVGLNYLREHVSPDVRLHYTITDGGKAPNIVPEKASGWYFVRASSRKNVEEVYQRVIRVAEGAAHMTETTMEVEFLGGCYNKLHNQVLCRLVHKCMENAGREAWSEDENEFATKINETAMGQYEKIVSKYHIPKGAQLHDEILPVLEEHSMASSDTGDVTWIVPTATFGTACIPLGTPGHSWQLAASAGSSMGFKGAMFAARSMALWGRELIRDSSILNSARTEFMAATKGNPYCSPLLTEKKENKSCLK